MSWFAELAGKAENLLNNLDEQTGAALRNHNVPKTRKIDKNEHILHNEPTWSQKKRPIPRTYKKITPITESRSNYTSNRKPSPQPQPRNGLENGRNGSPKPKKNLSRRGSPSYTLENCPNTLVGDVKDGIVIDEFALKHRRSSLPVDLEVANNNGWTYKLQNLIIENAMLTNERNVMNREMTELVDRLHRTEDDLGKTHLKLENLEMELNGINSDNVSLQTLVGQLNQRINELTEVDIAKYKDINQSLETQISILQENSKDLEERLREQCRKLKDKETEHHKVETELRHAQSTIGELQNNLEKSVSECRRLEKDWGTYKLRVKSMLHSKDNEIKALQNGIDHTEDTKMMMEQMDSLKVERDELSEAVSLVRNECNDMKQYVEQLESRHNAAERVVGALRDALKEERAARNRAEAHCIALGKELKSLQIDTGQTIASLRTALRDKDNELNNLRDSTSSLRSSADTSALNVADYDVTRDSIDTEKIHYLTQTLVQKQGKIDSLLADNNILRIQLEKLENKYKSEVSASRSKYTHSVVPLQDADIRFRSRNYIPDSTLSALSMRIGVIIKRFPIFRILILIYMVGLHLWVLTVLFTSTPEDYVTKPKKS